jgi:syndecan 4
VGAQGSCDSCPSGQITTGGDGTGNTRSACGACPDGYSCDGSSVKTPCPAGKYASTGSASPGVCIACNADNKYSAGGANACQTCAAGSYTNGGDANTRTACTACPAGQKCLGGHSRSDCDKGTYAAGGTATCSACGADNLYSGIKASSCSTCLAGSYTGGGGSSTRQTCSSCSGGHTCDGNSGMTACLAGTYAAAGASTCTNCGADNKYAGSSSPSCATCAPGSYVSGGDVNTRHSCTTCPVGHSCLTGGADKVQCSTGWYAATGQTACAKCR